MDFICYFSVIKVLIPSLTAVRTLFTTFIDGFDAVNMFPSTDNNSGLKSVHDILEFCDSEFPPTSSIIEDIDLCLSYDNSIFNNTNYLPTDSTAQRPHINLAPMQI